MPLLATDRAGAAYATDRYGLLFALLLGVFALAAFDDSTRIIRVGQGLFVVAIVLTTLLVSGTTPHRFRRASMLAGGLGLAVVIGGALGGDAIRGSIAVVSGGVLMLGVAALVRHIFESERITGRQIGASIAAYIEIALAFSLIYGGVAQLMSEPFFAQGDPGGLPFLYFSVVTMTTLGYGDLSPATDLGRSLVMVQTLFGQVFLVVLVAYLVGSLGAAPIRRRSSGPSQTGGGSDSAG